MIHLPTNSDHWKTMNNMVSCMGLMDYDKIDEIEIMVPNTQRLSSERMKNEPLSKCPLPWTTFSQEITVYVVGVSSGTIFQMCVNFPPWHYADNN